MLMNLILVRLICLSLQSFIRSQHKDDFHANNPDANLAAKGGGPVTMTQWSNQLYNYVPNNTTFGISPGKFVLTFGGKNY